MNIESYIEHMGRTYAVDLVSHQVFAQVEIKNPDVGNKRIKWVRTTGFRVRRVVLFLAQQKASA